MFVFAGILSVLRESANWQENKQYFRRTGAMDETQTTIHSYNQNAKAYADKFMCHAPYVKQAKTFAQLLGCGNSVLDIGCGPGNVAKQLLAVKPLQITGVDLSGEMVKLASANVPSGRFYCQDIRHVDFDEASFDAVVLSFSIVHLQDAEADKLLRKAISWTKRNGHLFVSFMAGKVAGFEQTSFSRQPIYFNYFDHGRIAQLLIEQGMEIIHLEQQDYHEPDGTITKDHFLFALRSSPCDKSDKPGI
jgi:ubiquinone/menaquinone biosynthesis C-methylase UbiE